MENVPDVMLWTLKANRLASSLSSLGHRPGVRSVSDTTDNCDDEIVEEREFAEPDVMVDEEEEERTRSGEQASEKCDNVTWE